MPHLLRPQGPLPARIYWTRRLMLLVLVAVVVLLVWWLVGRGGSAGADPSAAAQAPSSGPQRQGKTAPDPTPPSTRPPQTVTSTHQQKQETKPTPSESTASLTQPTPTHQTPTRTTPTTATATADAGAVDRTCDPRSVDLKLKVSDVASGEPGKVRFVLSSAKPCMLTITPDTLAVKVTSGSDTIWSSVDCPDDVPARRLEVPTDPKAVYTFTWNGHRSTDQCRGVGSVAEPGGYWVHAALIGGEPHKAYFDVTAAN